MKKSHAYMRLTEHHMPHMKGMELGKRYHVKMEIEPTELSTGDSEYGEMIGPDGKSEKPPMRGSFKVHSIVEHKPAKGMPAKKAQGRYA